MAGLSGQNWDLFRATCDAQTIAVTASDPDQHDAPLVYANKIFLDLTGYGEREVLGRNCRFLQGPDTLAADHKMLRDAIADGGYSATCLLNYRKDGTPFFNMVVIDEILISRRKRLLLGCQYKFGRQISISEMYEQFQRTDVLLSQLADQSYRAFREVSVMRAEALTAMVRARLMMAWVGENVDKGAYSVDRA